MPLVKRGNSKFWYVQFQLNHQTIIRSTRTTDRKVAEKLEAKIRSEAHDEIVMGKKKPSRSARPWLCSSGRRKAPQTTPIW